MKNSFNKAFIFDMDGVIINSEPVWERYEQKFLPKLLGKDIYLKIKDQILGNSVSAIYTAASEYGLKITKKEFERIFDQYAKLVYKEAKITDWIPELFNKLISMNFKLGLVSSSRQNWIDLVIKKLNGKKLFQFVMSLDGDTVKPKPYPDGYLKAITKLNSKPSLAIIIEDSQRGIQAAKSSGAFVICLKENLPENYLPKGADIYVNSIKELYDNNY